MNRPPFPQVIDSTMYNDLLACPTKFYREHLEHWKPRELSVHLHAGAAFARGLEVTRQSFWDESLSPLESLARGMHALTLAYGAFEAPPGSPEYPEAPASPADPLIELLTPRSMKAPLT